MATYDINEILKILPHRYPFLLVDRVTDCNFEEKRITAIKNVSVNEPFFQGHFPENPIMPGVLQLEALAQVGGILMNQLYKREGAIAYFISVDNAKFRRAVRPGDTLLMSIEFTRTRLRMAKLHGEIFVGDEMACQADLMFAYKD